MCREVCGLATKRVPLCLMHIVKRCVHMIHVWWASLLICFEIIAFEVYHHLVNFNKNISTKIGLWKYFDT